MINNLNNIIVVKIGGSTLGQHDTTLIDLVEMQKRHLPVVVVHGGGKMITDWLSKLSASTKFVQGERVTDKTGLEVATAVLCGVVNKDLVSTIIASGGKAVGLSGVDGALLQSVVKNPELGFVGNIIKVDTGLLLNLLNAGYIPVISSISLNPGSAADTPKLLNVNADVAAGEIAFTLPAHKLIFLTDIAGICDMSGQVIPALSIQEAEALIASGVATSGMIPKIRSGIRAVHGSAVARIIDGRRPHALLNEIESSLGGTTIYNQK